MPLISGRIGLWVGIAALTLCFQQESVSILASSKESKTKANNKMRLGFATAFLLLSSITVMGSVGFVTLGLTSPRRREIFSVSDTYTGSTDMERLVVSVIQVLQLGSTVPMYAYIGASYVCRAYGRCRRRRGSSWLGED